MKKMLQMIAPHNLGMTTSKLSKTKERNLLIMAIRIFGSHLETWITVKVLKMIKALIKVALIAGFISNRKFNQMIITSYFKLSFLIGIAFYLAFKGCFEDR